MYDSDGETDFPNPRSHVVMPLRRTTCIVETSHFDHVAGVQFFVDRRFHDTIARKCNQLNYYIIVRKWGWNRVNTILVITTYCLNFSPCGYTHFVNNPWDDENVYS